MNTMISRNISLLGSLIRLTPIIFSALFLSCASTHEDHDEEEHDHEHSEGIHFEPEKASEFGVEYETVAPSEFYDVIKTSGEIEASNSDIFKITARKSGIITLSPDISAGMSVTKGERIGSISVEGVQGGDVSKAASANLEAAKKEYERMKPLFEDGLVTASAFREVERQYKEAEALAGKGTAGGTTMVSSPESGTIQELFVRSGEYVDVGSPIALVGKNVNMVLRADLPAREIRHLGEIETANFISESNPEIVRLSDFGGKKISGPKSSASNGYVPVYFSFTGNPLISSGGFAEVYLICGERNGVISVPREALVEIQGNKYVYTYNGEHEYDKRLVKTGSTDGERVEILDGLVPGERIVSKGASIIRMAEVSSIAPPSHTHNH